MAYGIILTAPCPDCHRKPGQAYCGDRCASEPLQPGSWGPGRAAREAAALASAPPPDEVPPVDNAKLEGADAVVPEPKRIPKAKAFAPPKRKPAPRRDRH